MEKNRQKKRTSHSNFIVQGSILAVAGIVVRLIGMLYRIPLINIVGDEGIGYYSAAFSIYSILLIVSSYSMPVAVSKMIAIRLARKEYCNSVRILRASLLYATVVGAVGAGAMWFGADLFAGMIKMPYSAFALKTLAPTVWVMAYLGVLRGYFQGHGSMVPTAVSQIVEQVANAIVSVAAASALFGYGSIVNLVHDETQYAFAYGAAGGTIGTGAGAFSALFLLFFMILSCRSTIRRQMRRDKDSYPETYGQITAALFLTIVPIVVSSTVYNISSVLDNAVYGQIMAQIGHKTSDIVSHWGIYMGKYHLLFNIPVAIANSLSSSLIPALSRAMAERNRAQVMKRIDVAVRFAMIVSIPSAMGLTVLAGPISNLLFGSSENGMLVNMMLVGSIAVVLFSLSTVTNAVLQGINRMRVPIRNAAIALVIHLGVLALMLRFTKLGIYSVVYANIFFAFVVCLLNAKAIRRHLRYRQEIKKTFVLPSVCALVMGPAAYGVYLAFYRLLNERIHVFLAARKAGKLLAELGAQEITPELTNEMTAMAHRLTAGMAVRCSNLISILPAMLVAVVVYGLLLVKLKCLNEEELTHMPKGRTLVRICRKFHLL